MPIHAVPPEVMRAVIAELDRRERESAEIRLAKFLRASARFQWPIEPRRGR